MVGKRRVKVLWWRKLGSAGRERQVHTILVYLPLLLGEVLRDWEILEVEALGAALADNGRLGAEPAPAMIERVLAQIRAKASHDFYMQRSRRWSIFDPRGRRITRRGRNRKVALSADKRNEVGARNKATG